MTEKTFSKLVLEKYGLPPERIPPDALDQIRRSLKADRFVNSSHIKGEGVDRGVRFNKTA